MPSASTSSTLILLGGGGHAAVVADAAMSCGMRVVGFADDDPGKSLPGLQHLGLISHALEQAAIERHLIHAAVGDNELRAMWLDGLESNRVAGIYHVSAVVSPNAVVEAGVFIGPLAIVNPRARVGRGAIINSGAIVEHDCGAGNFCHIAPGAVLGGGSRVGEQTLIGLNASVLPGIKIGSKTILGAGAVATSHVPDNCTAVGAPARAMTTTS